jgi:hypothetical protein
MSCAACGEQQRAEPIQTTDLPAATTPAAAACALRPVSYEHGRLKDTFLIGGGAADPLKREAVFARRRIQINTDGAPNSYHSEAINADQPSIGAINIVCNSGTKLYAWGLWSYLKSFFVTPEPIACYSKSGISVDPKYTEIYNAIKANDWSPAAGHRIEFNWAILAKASSDAGWFASLFAKDRPCIADGGFFVSKTKLSRHAPKDSCDQSAWLDANEEKAFVLPQHWFADWTTPGAQRWASFEPGDVVVAYRAAEGDRPETWVYGVVGDAGPIYKLGEATLAFNWQLHRRRGAIRDEIRTYRKAIELDTDTLKPQQIPLLVLEGTAPALGGDYSSANIDAKAREVFDGWGGPERFKACLATLP